MVVDDDDDDCLNLAILTFINCTAAVLILILKHTVSLQLSLCISNLAKCNSLYCDLSESQLNHLKQMQNFLPHAVIEARKFTLTIYILKSLYL